LFAGCPCSFQFFVQPLAKSAFNNERYKTMKSTTIALVLTSALALSACAQNGEDNSWGMGTKQTVGTGAGALVGGILGSKVGGGGGRLWATGAGALLGAFAGSSIGKSLDESDKAAHEKAMEQAESGPLNQPVNWSNPNGHSGSITPIREGRQANTGNPCREYKQTIVIDGQAQSATGTACQNSDGTWSLVNGTPKSGSGSNSNSGSGDSDQ
jgi:surface antigen